MWGTIIAKSSGGSPPTLPQNTALNAELRGLQISLCPAICDTLKFEHSVVVDWNHFDIVSDHNGCGGKE